MEMIRLIAAPSEKALGYAQTASKMGVPILMVLPNQLPEKAKRVLNQLGVGLMYTPKAQGLAGAKEVVDELVQMDPKRYLHFRGW